MESNTLTGTQRIAGVSVVDPSRRAARMATGAAPRFVTASRSLAGVGSYDVSGTWRLDRAMDPQAVDPKLNPSTAEQHIFTTRQGPPSCSPPA